MEGYLIVREGPYYIIIGDLRTTQRIIAYPPHLCRDSLATSETKRRRRYSWSYIYW